MKMMILAPRKLGMTHQEFRDYVVNVHGPLVRSVPEVAADIFHYHYNFPVRGAEDPLFGHPVATHLDIVTQGWFASREAQLQNMARPRYLQIIRPDEGRFANEAGALMHYTREALVLDGAPSLAKVFYFRRRHPSLGRAAFQAEWLGRFPAALGLSRTPVAGVSRYVQNQVLPESDHPDGQSDKFFDVIDEFHLDPHRSPSDSILVNELVSRVSACERELLDTSRTLAFVAYTIHNIP